MLLYRGLVYPKRGAHPCRACSGALSYIILSFPFTAPWALTVTWLCAAAGGSETQEQAMICDSSSHTSGQLHLCPQVGTALSMPSSLG
jgi:hypothetical protein